MYQPERETTLPSVDGEYAPLIALGGAALLSLLLSAQVFAWQLSHRPELGPPLTAVADWPVYGPLQMVRWWRVYRGLEALGSVFLLTYVVGGGGFLAFFVGGLALFGGGGKRTAGGSHGTAQWSSGEALRIRDGYPLGRAGDGTLLRFDGEGHLLTLAPTRSGKTVSVLGPVLLEHMGSAFVVDPKPELAAVTARRRREMGQRIEVIDLFGEGETAGINPLDFVRVGPELIDEARMIAELLIADRESAKVRDDHWDEQAIGFCAALLAYIVCHVPPSRRHLVELRRLVALPRLGKPDPGGFEELIEQMMRSTAADGMVSREAATLASMPHKEWSGVINTLRKHTRFLDSRRLQRAITRSTFDLRDLKRARLTVYVCLPSHKLRVYYRALRLLLGCASYAIKSVPGKPRAKILMAIDEFQNLGRLQTVEEDISLGGSSGMQWWLFVQDLGRLQSVYPGGAEKTFLANADVLQTFGASNDLETLEFLSRLTGEATILVRSDTESRGRSSGAKMASRQRGRGGSVSEKSRRLLTLDEVRTLPPGEELLFVKGQHPIRCRKLSYLTDPEWRGRFDPNPQHEVAT